MNIEEKRVRRKRHKEPKPAISLHPDTFKNERRIIDTNHALERFILRYGSERDRIEIMWVINNGMKKILSEYKDESNKYIIHSKSTGIGVVIHWRKDSKGFDNLNHAIIATILAKKDAHYKKYASDIMLIVENWVNRRQKEMNVNRCLTESTYDRVEQELWTDDTIVQLPFEIHLWEGKIWDFSECVIEVV